MSSRRSVYAGLLILYGDWPRSLAASIAEVQQLIERVTNGRSSETPRLATQLCQAGRRPHQGHSGERTASSTWSISSRA